MKKFLAILLSALMLFSCTALAERVQFVEGSKDFDIFVDVDDDVEHVLFDSKGGVPMAHFQKKGSDAHVFVDILSSEQYEGNMKDLSEEDRQQLIADWSMGFSDTVEITTETTPKGNMYLHFHDIDNTNVETLVTLYAGYTVTFVLYPEPGTKLTEADHDFMMQLFHNLEIVPVAK